MLCAVAMPVMSSLLAMALPPFAVIASTTSAAGAAPQWFAPPFGPPAAR